MPIDSSMTVDVTAVSEPDLRRSSFANMNDWLNTLVGRRIAQARHAGETLSEEMAFVEEHRHCVYQNRFKPLVLSVLGLSAYGILQSENALALAATFVAIYFYLDFYSGVLHVVLDNPRFVRLPLIGVPCVEFQWHHTFAYDISTRRLLDVWGDLNVLVLVKSLVLFGVCGFSSTTFMVAGVGFFWGYVNQFAHRLTHTAASRRPPWAVWLQEHRVLLPAEVHHEHHRTYDQAFPVLSGHSRGVIATLLRWVPNQWAWLAFFCLLTALDLVFFVQMVDRLFQG